MILDYLQFNYNLIWHVPWVNLSTGVQVSKALLGEYLKTQKLKKPFEGLGLEHMNNPSLVIPINLTSSIIKTSEFQVINPCNPITFNFLCRVYYILN